MNLELETIKHCSTQKFKKKSFQGFGELFERPITVYSDNTHFLKANKLQALKKVQLTNSATKLSGVTVE